MEGGKSGHQRTPCPGKPGVLLQAETDSATENRLPFVAENEVNPPSLKLRRVKVKRWGKSSPLRMVTCGWLGKPHGVQVHTGCVPFVTIQPGGTHR